MSKGFVIKKVSSFTWPVKIKTPTDGGKYEEQVLELEFKKIGSQEMKDLMAKTNEFAGLCGDVIIGWKNVKDESGESIPFSKEALETILDVYGVAPQIAEQYLQAFTGAVAKN